ncbi:MAG: NADP(H)-dependent aldo-keto reductase [Pseudanabaena sp. ELA607]
MKYHNLGQTNLQVSQICLGTMTYGQQNTEAEAHEQLDYAVSQGINFIDTAEMYPVPPRSETQGKTEAYIGSWLKKQQRDQLIIATKIIGSGRNFPWVRESQKPALSAANIRQAVDDSLQRLQTDYIDLYQIHWPDRYVPLFGQPNYDPVNDRAFIPLQEQLATFAELIAEGKIRYLGVSNETPWGVCNFVNLAKLHNLPLIASIQNAYNLLNRVFEFGLSEVCHREQLGLLAYSPLAFGLLTGKYINDSPPPASRLAQFPNFGQRYHKPNVELAVIEYCELAHRYAINPTHLALSFVRSRWFVQSTIIGATSVEQLSENIASLEVDLSDEILKEIETIHARYSNPAP